MKSLQETITESKKLDIYQCAEGLVNIMLENKDDVMDVIESFLELVEDDLENKNSSSIKAFRDGVLDYSKSW